MKKNLLFSIFCCLSCSWNAREGEQPHLQVDSFNNLLPYKNKENGNWEQWDACRFEWDSSSILPNPGPTMDTDLGWGKEGQEFYLKSKPFLDKVKPLKLTHEL